MSRSPQNIYSPAQAPLACLTEEIRGLPPPGSPCASTGSWKQCEKWIREGGGVRLGIQGEVCRHPDGRWRGGTSGSWQFESLFWRNNLWDLITGWERTLGQAPGLDGGRKVEGREGRCRDDFGRGCATRAVWDKQQAQRRRGVQG